MPGRDVDLIGKAIDDQEHQDGVVAETKQLLDTEAIDIFDVCLHA
jgi:hypothetical protein